jgi:hypothetical protein
MSTTVYCLYSFNNEHHHWVTLTDVLYAYRLNKRHNTTYKAKTLHRAPFDDEDDDSDDYDDKDKANVINHH